MLKYIRVKNFLSFKEDTTISFESDLRGKKDNVFEIGNGDKLMKNMLIYGANASGKSNIIQLIDFIVSFVLSSYNKDFLDNYELPFLLDTSTIEESSFFEISFFIENREFIYNFEILDKKILSENLFEIILVNKKYIDKLLFKRTFLDIIAGEGFEGELEKGKEKIRDDSSIISVLSQWNGKLAGKEIDYFFKKIDTISIDNIGTKFTGHMIKSNSDYKEFVINFLRFADINIDDINIGKVRIGKEILDSINEKFKDENEKKDFLNYLGTDIQFGHKVKGSNDLKYFNLKNESDGTKKLFSILGPIVDTILNENILFIDEIENNLHVHILQELLKLINSDIQSKKYQFIFTTHNLELMDLKLFKKQQIGIVEKNTFGNSSFYTLNDFEKIRSETDIKKYYNAGILGGVPNIGDFRMLLNNFKPGEKKED